MYMCGGYRNCGCVHVWVVGMYMCGVHRDCGCVDVWSAYGTVAGRTTTHM